MTDMYLRLDYRQYKALEEQLRSWEKTETVHTSVDGYYHKALRLDIGDLTLEIQGPAVREPVRDTAEDGDGIRLLRTQFADLLHVNAKLKAQLERYGRNDDTEGTS